MEILETILKWFKRCAEPNLKRRYSSCPICGATWWDNKEQHNRDCWIPELENKLRAPAKDKNGQNETSTNSPILQPQEPTAT